MNKLGVYVAAIALCSLGGLAFLSGNAAAQGPPCPASWPGQDHDGFFTDAEGSGWFVIRSADDNGYRMIRAYVADDGYDVGYVPNSPDEVCYLLVRRPNEAQDMEQPTQVIFPREREEPTTEPPTLASAATTLLDLLNSLPPEDRQAAILCLAQIAGNRTLAELNDDPDFLQRAIDHGCLPG